MAIMPIIADNVPCQTCPVKTNVRNRYLPNGKLMLVNAWVEIHREELLANWVTGKQTGEYFQLQPLR